MTAKFKMSTDELLNFDGIGKTFYQPTAPPKKSATSKVSPPRGSPKRSTTSKKRKDVEYDEEAWRKRRNKQQLEIKKKIKKLRDKYSFDLAVQPSEIKFFKKLRVLHDVWGYNRGNGSFENETHAHSSDLQHYTDPIFRNLHKLITNELPVFAYSDVYSKLKSCMVIANHQSVQLMQRALKKKGFKGALLKLATFKPISFKMRVIVAFANALFEIAENRLQEAYNRMEVLKQLYNEMTEFD